MKQMPSRAKRILLILLLALALFLLASCYMEPDRVVDNTGLDNNPSQTFESVLTPTPSPTELIVTTPTPDTGAVDWNNWTFGNDTPTDVPPEVQNTPEPGTTQLPMGPTMPPQGTNAGTTATATPGAKPTITPTAAPTSLKKGAKGSDVKKLQQRLKDLNYYTGTVDGTYGEGTENAVKAFQKANGLTADGKAGANTLNKLYSSSAKKASYATATPKSSSPKTPAATAVPTSKYTTGKTNVYLKLGDSGANVKYMQNRLIELGYLTGTADGSFGATTEAAVKAFQKRNDIWSDGVAGPSTLTLMYSSACKRATSPAGTLGSLKEGYSGTAVRTLQTNLKKLGYYKGVVDGDYGEGTTAAVMSFQADHGLKADGIAGTSTQNAIAAALSGGSGGGSSSSTDPAKYGTTASSNGYTTLCSTNGSKAKITNLQSTLSSLGYYNGAVNGTYNRKTESAVKEYQKAIGLRATGMAGPTTQRLLYGNAKETGSYTKLERGSSGDNVKKLQYALYELKYYDGKITGEYDSATENAVLEFQEKNGLDCDGVAGTGTQRRLFSSNAIPHY